MTNIVVIAAFVVAPLSGVVMFWLGLHLLRWVYERGGTADLAEAATSRLLAYGIQPDGHEMPAAPHRGARRSTPRRHRRGTGTASTPALMKGR
ncbi:hypothetical protein AB0K48_17110 [Nonomuraea sp. NPDC055795]